MKWRGGYMKIILLLLCLSLGACASSSSSQLCIYDETTFKNVFPVLKEGLVENEIAEVAYMDLNSFSALSLPHVQGARDKLYNNLSLSFLYADTNINQKPVFFNSYVLQGEKITENRHGFDIKNNREEIEVRLLGEVDWNKDGKNDWIVNCRFWQRLPIFPLEGNKNVVSPESIRDYIILIDNVGEEILLGKTLFMREFFKDGGGERVTIYDERRPDNGTLLPHVVMEYEQGEKEVVNNNKNSAPSSQNTDGVKEEKLLN